MRKLIAAALVLAPYAASAAQPAPQPGAAAKPACDRFARAEQAQSRAVLREPGASARRLDRLPAADLHLTVERDLDGCRIPVIVRQNFGGATPARR